MQGSFALHCDIVSRSSVGKQKKHVKCLWKAITSTLSKRIGSFNAQFIENQLISADYNLHAYANYLLTQKEELRQIRQDQLEKLSERNYKAREKNRRRLEVARSRLLTMNQEGQSELKVVKGQKIEQALLTKTKQSMLNDQITIIKWTLNKNQQNLQTYQKRIKQQSRLKKGKKAKVRRLSKQIEIINKSVSIKTNYLNCIAEEINKNKTNIKNFRQQHETQINKPVVQQTIIKCPSKIPLTR